MRYDHPHLSFEEQADLLISRGLQADRTILMQRLQAVGYTRFTAYLHPFLIPNGDKQLLPCTTLDKVWDIYLFDRRLRLLLMDAVERIEIALRSLLVHFHTKGTTPFDYARADYFPHWYKYPDILRKFHVGHISNMSSNLDSGDAAGAFFARYGDVHEFPPLWISIGMLDFGTTVYFYRNSTKCIREALAKEWELDTSPLDSWLTALRLLRNCCAHHCRIWNRQFSSYPNLHHASSPAWRYVYSETRRCWVRPAPGDSRKSLMDYRQRLGPLLFISRYLLRKVAPTSRWHERVAALMGKAALKGIPLAAAGLPEHWATHPLWV